MVKTIREFTFEVFLAAISTRNVSFKTLKRVYVGLFSFLWDTIEIISFLCRSYFVYCVQILSEQRLSRAALEVSCARYLRCRDERVLCPRFYERGYIAPFALIIKRMISLALFCISRSFLCAFPTPFR